MNGVEALCILHGCMSMSMPEFKLRCSLMGRVGYNRFVKSIKVSESKIDGGVNSKKRIES